MTRNRLEAFSDGVIAILITIMVLEMKVPHGSDIHALLQVWPVFLSYVLSFIYLGIYWSNHHHLFQVVEKVNGRILWANLHLLFWLSLIPFVTGWMGENHFARVPVAMYGVILFNCSVAYTVLIIVLIRAHGRDSTLARALGRDFKGKISTVIYVLAIALACWRGWAACALYAAVAVIWLAPDRRIETVLQIPPKANKSPGF